MEKGEPLKIYLAHGKHHRFDGKWIEYQIKKWGHKISNPFDGTTQAKELTKKWEEEIEPKARYSWLNDEEKKLINKLSKKIHKKDMRGIKDSQVVLAFYPDESTGTAQEITISKIKYDKTVIVMTDVIHPFIFVYADYIIPPIPEAMRKLRELLEQLEKKL